MCLYVPKLLANLTRSVLGVTSNDAFHKLELDLLRVNKSYVTCERAVVSEYEFQITSCLAANAN